LREGAAADGVAPLPPDCWRQVFGNDRPIAVEIGPGRGEFLIDAARRAPAWNFFAIEHSASRAAEVAARLRRAGITNARVLGADATCLLELVPERSVSAFYVLFPDPWWKRRHHKRRLMTPRFVAALRRALCPGGTMELITDVEEYFGLAGEALGGDPGLEVVADPPARDLQTSFARKAVRRGATIHHCVYRRCAD
jgi:tRNA (guanine-N7-)-methyltransferase